jgi:hypothetical protein
MSQLNKSLQGPGENTLSSSDKILGFKRMNLWKNNVVKRNLEMFPLLLGLENEGRYQQVLSLIENHPEELWNKIKYYFPSLLIHVYGRVMNPYSESSAQPENLTLREKEELCEQQCYCTLKMRVTDLSLDRFWFSMKEGYPAIHRKAIKIAAVFDFLHV